MSKRLNAVSGSSNDNNEITKNDDYYLDIGSEPPRFAYYRHYRVKNSKDEWRKQTLEAAYDSVTQNELDYSLKRKLRMSPEQRYQHEKGNWFFHELSYLHQTVDENGKAVDIIKESGCGHWSNKAEEGGCCVPECRYYPEYGRIEDDEVIAEHKMREEEYRKCDRIINIDISANSEKYNDYQKFLKMWDNIT